MPSALLPLDRPRPHYHILRGKWHKPGLIEMRTFAATLVMFALVSTPALAQITGTATGATPGTAGSLGTPAGSLSSSSTPQAGGTAGSPATTLSISNGTTTQSNSTVSNTAVGNNAVSNNVVANSIVQSNITAAGAASSPGTAGGTGTSAGGTSTTGSSTTGSSSPSAAGGAASGSVLILCPPNDPLIASEIAGTNLSCVP